MMEETVVVELFDELSGPDHVKKRLIAEMDHSREVVKTLQRELRKAKKEIANLTPELVVV